MQPPNWSLPTSSPNLPWKQVWVANSPVSKSIHKIWKLPITWLLAVCLSINSWGNNIQTCVKSIRASCNLIIPFHIVGSTDNNISGKKAHLCSRFKNCPIRQCDRHTQMSVSQWFGQSEGSTVSWNWGNSHKLILTLTVSVNSVKTHFWLLALALITFLHNYLHIFYSI